MVLRDTRAPFHKPPGWTVLQHMPSLMGQSQKEGYQISLIDVTIIFFLLSVC